MAQLDLACAGDSLAHSSIVESMIRRRVVMLMTANVQKDIRSLVFNTNAWNSGRRQDRSHMRFETRMSHVPGDFLGHQDLKMC